MSTQAVVTQPPDITNVIAQQGEPITQRLIDMLTSIASHQNQTAVDTYEEQLTEYKAAVAWTTAVNTSNASRGVAPVPVPVAPVAPMIRIVDAAYVHQVQQMDVAIDPAKVFVLIPYVHIDPVPPPTPQLVINPAPVPGMPGFFEAQSGDSGSIPAGTRVEQDGKTYEKHLFGFMGSSLWQRVS